jgi:hypothetical protein
VRRLLLLTAVLMAIGCAPASAQVPVLSPPFTNNYAVSVIGAPAGVPTRFGGLTLKAGTTDKLLLGGAANSADGALYEVTVARDPQGHISGFVGTATRYAAAAYNDGGIVYGPGNVLFLARWPVNELGQTKPGSSVTDKVTPLTSLGIESSLVALRFVPQGSPGAGHLKLVSYSGGAWYDAGVAPDGAGTYNLTGVSEVTASRLSGGAVGFVYVNRGSAQFSRPSMLVSEYSAGQVAAYAVDANGDPIVSTRRTVITGLSGADGAFIDPVTGDFLFSTFGGGDRVVVVRGFAKALPPPVAGKNVNALPAGGTVKVKLPGKKGFKTLKAGQQVPVGTTVDTSKGRITLVTAAAGGATDQADFYDGVFKVGQAKGSKLTTLTLVEKLACKGSGKAASAAKKKKRKRRLWGDGNGKFRTKGAFSSATVRGTKWLVQDTCSTTLTRIARGKVAVRDFAKKKTVIVKAGKKYLARAKH